MPTASRMVVRTRPAPVPSHSRPKRSMSGEAGSSKVSAGRNAGLIEPAATSDVPSVPRRTIGSAQLRRRAAAKRSP